MFSAILILILLHNCNTITSYCKPLSIQLPTYKYVTYLFVAPVSKAVENDFFAGMDTYTRILQN